MKSMKYVVFVLSSLFVIPVFLTAQEKILTKSKVDMIYEMMSKYQTIDMFSGIVLVAEKGSIVFKNAYGYSDREKKIQNTSMTEFDLASVSKLFTVTAILQLFDKGMLSMDDNVGKYLDGFSKEISEKVTIRHLLTMTSGMTNYMDAEFQKNPSKFVTINDRLDLITRQNPKLAFEPGEKFFYSNSGYIMLGGIIEKITGTDYFTYVQKNILSPLKMDHTHFYNLEDRHGRAVGYNRDISGTYVKAAFLIPPSSDGNLSSSADDLLMFTLKFCIGNDLVSEKAKILFFSSIDTTYKGDLNSLKSDSKTRKFGWVGGFSGISTVIRHSIVNDVSIIVLSNYNNSDISNEITGKIETIIASGYYEDVTLPLLERMYSTYLSEGIELLKTNFSKNDYEKNATILGYFFLRSKKTQEAIQIFTSLVDLYPNSFNAFDSLAEAYMMAGNKELAVKNYQRSLELNPKNTNAAEQLKKLKE